MPHSHFVHLHNHTEYSFLDGAIPVKKLVRRAVEYKMPALALTDHGGMFGAAEFYHSCMQAGIKPIIGFEAYIIPESRLKRGSGNGQGASANHIVLLARNQEGYENLMRLTSIGYLEGFYYKPRIDKEVLKKHAAGLIGLSACLKGEIPTLLQEKYDQARESALELQEIFGIGHFYLEIQNHGIDDEIIAFKRVIELSREIKIPLVLTNDAHYLDHKDSSAHEILLCIQTGKTLNDTDRMRFTSDQVYFKSPQEMAELFPEEKEAYENTLKVAEMCNVKIGTKELMLPKFPLPEGFGTEEELLRHLAREGLEKRYNKVTPGLEQRLEYELDIICKMKYSGYFLIVADFTKAARKKGIYVGCRGSAAASLVAYSLFITDIDPIRFNLFFERFLNPERVSMPDADIDFSDRDRQQVIDYVVEKYGRSNVCQIITYGTMQAKAVVRDVARVMGLPYSDGDRIAKLIPLGKDLRESWEMVSELKELIGSRGDLKRLWELALVLEGLIRQPGMHAAGLIIAKDEIVRFAPLYKPSDSNDVMCQYDMTRVEDVGLVKMDFLGLKTLTVLQDAVLLIRKNHGKDIDLWHIPYDDKPTYELFGHGDTAGIFQFESNGMRDYLRKLKPERIDDLIAMNALYRPGPMDSIDSYIHRKHGREKIEYLHPALEPVLKETYGVITYQEDVMMIAREIAGFSLGRADNLRRAMSKKKAEEMEKARKEFVQGAVAKKVDAAIAEKIFEPMAKFAGYGFNKAHAAVYAHLAYQSGYLKTHYPSEYMAALLSSYMGDSDDIVKYVQECRRMKVEVLPPDVNESDEYFTVVGKGKIRFGLAAVKNVGDAAVESIKKVRKEKGPFTNLFDFAQRVDLRTANKRVIESLIVSGAFDSFPGSRSQKFAAIDSVIEYGQSFQEDQERGQTSLFDMGDSSPTSLASTSQPALPEVPLWPYMDLLTKEKEVLGMYVTGHPLEKYRDEVMGLVSLHFSKEEFESTPDDKEVIVGGIITNVKTIVTKRDGKPMAFIVLEDFFGTIEIVVFPDIYEKHTACFQNDTMIMISGKFEKKEERAKMLASNVMMLSDAREKLTRSVHVHLKTAGLEDAQLQEIKNICAKTAGPCKLVLHVHTHDGNEYRIGSNTVKTRASPEIIEALRGIVGNDYVTIGRNAVK
jgi:DNA polymerase-3 subunit alpha